MKHLVMVWLKSNWIVVASNKYNLFRCFNNQLKNTINFANTRLVIDKNGIPQRIIDLKRIFCKKKGTVIVKSYRQ